MRKSSIIILLLNVISIGIGLYILRDADQLVSNYAIDNPNHLPLSKANLLLVGIVPFIVVFTMDIVATIEAEQVRPFIKYYDRLKYVICFAFQLLFTLIVASQVITINEKHISGMLVAFVIFYIGYIIPNIRRNQVLGFKNKWTLGSDMVWDKVHKRLQIIAYLAAIIVLILTFWKHFAVATVTVVLISLAVAYLFYYSYKLGNEDEQ